MIRLKCFDGIGCGKCTNEHYLRGRADGRAEGRAEATEECIEALKSEMEKSANANDYYIYGLQVAVSKLEELKEEKNK